mgnify:CR=1 FL=1
MAQTHMIKKQILDIKTETEVGSFVLQSELSKIYHEEMVPLIDEYCTLLSAEDETIRIDKLELDLGTINRRFLRRELIQQLKEQLNRNLNQYLVKKEAKYSQNPNHEVNDGTMNESVELQKESDKNVRSFKKNSDARSEVIILEYFLKKGRLPWWVRKNRKIEFKKVIEDLINENSDKSKMFFTRILSDEQSMKRLIYQFSGFLRFEQILKLFHHEASFFNELVSQTLKLDFLDHKNTLELKYKLNRILLPRLMKKELSPEVAVNEIVEFMSKTYSNDYKTIHENLKKTLEKKGYGIHFKKDESRADKAVNKILESVKNSMNRLEGIIRLLKQTITSEKLDKDKKTSIDKIIEKLTDSIKNSEKVIKNHQLENLQVLENEDEKLSDIFMKLIDDLILIFDVPFVERQKFKNALSQVTSKSENKELIQSEKADQFSESEEIYIQNAGLILAWPYLETLFKINRLVKENHFIGENEQNQALGLLHYMSYGSVDYSEYDCILNKILCGLEIEEPVYSNSRISDDKYEECDRLCTKLITNWPAVKNMSIPVLREMFFKREGVLVKQGAFWLLKIENKTHDILLDQLPWSINVIKLPWMKIPLMVEWRL